MRLLLALPLLLLASCSTPNQRIHRIEWGAHPALAGETPQEACAATGTRCAAMLLNHANRDRALHGAPPLRMDWYEAHGTATCPGSAGHARHMAAEGVISHDQFPSDECGSWTAIAENVGAAGGSKEQASLAILAEMLAEPWSPGCSGNHVCSLRSSTYTRVGFGFAQSNGTWYVSMDFQR